MAPQTMKERVMVAAEKDRQRREAERADPKAAEARKAAQRAAYAAEKAEHEARQWARMDAHLRACGVAALEIKALRVGLSDSWQALREVREWLKGTESHLLLLGNPGTGKTLAGAEAVSTCRFWYQHPDWGRTWAWPEGLSDAGVYILSGEVATTSYFGQESEDVRRRLVGCRLLVMDELGTEVMSSTWLSLLDTIINQRHRAKRKTLLLSNLSGPDFKTRYGERIARRVREEGKAVSLGAVTLSGREGGQP